MSKNHFDRYIKRRALHRDGYLCCNCGMAALEAHHVVPLAVGGNDVLSNLISLCATCHNLVHDRRRVSHCHLRQIGSTSAKAERKGRRQVARNTQKKTPAKSKACLPAIRKEALHVIGMVEILSRFEQGELILANDPTVIALHAAATSFRGQLAAAVGASPGKLPSGTLRNVLRACGWRLELAGRTRTRGANRDVLFYSAHPEIEKKMKAGDCMEER